MCAPSPPPAPDYTGAANAQGAANLEAARATGRMNNPNVNNPYGTQTVTWDGDTPTLNQTLSPTEQGIYDTNAANRTGLGNLAGQGIDSLRGLIGSQLDFSGAPQAGTALDINSILGKMPTALIPGGLPTMPTAYTGSGGYDAVRQKVMDAMMGRANTDIGNQQSQIQSDLVARGLTPGSKGFETEMDRLNRERVDARQQAELAGGNAAQQALGMDLSSQGQQFAQGMGIRQQAQGEQGQQFAQSGQLAQLLQSLQGQSFGQTDALRKQFISELLTKRQMPLNEITALMSGSQVSNPFAVPGYAQNANVAPPPLFGATQAQGAWDQNAYNQNVGSYNNMMSGLFKLGGAGIGLFG